MPRPEPRDDENVTDEGPEPSKPLGDQPIEDISQDELGREGFVYGLRDEVRDAPAEGFVIGVTGDWGSGKTSVINMALNPLAKEPLFRIVRFNPWLFSGTPQLIEHFFTELSSQLREAGRRSKREGLVRLSETISGYADILDPLRFAPGVDAAVRAGRASAGVLGHLGRKPTSVHEQKAVLNKLLAEHDERLVIVMDDIDRLTDSEIRDVVRLVRLVGDFPNTVYVLAYAPKSVARALGGAEGLVAGQAYLEKIVQVTVPVPAIDPEQLSTLLSGRIEAALAGLSYELDREHWSLVYMGMRPFFRTLRDVLRYCNAVRSPAKHLVAELDVVDILGLEALRIFEPSVWERIDELAEPLTAPGDQYLINRDRDAADERIRTVVEQAGHPDQVRDLLQALFPVSGRALGRSNYGSDFMSTWRRRGRVAHIENLRVYLSRQVTAKGASRGLAVEAVAAMRDPDRARALFRSVEDARLPALLSRIGDYEDDLPIEAAASIPVLYELRPRLPEGGVFDGGPEIRIGSVVYRIMKSWPPRTVAEMLDEVAPQLQLLSDRISLLRTTGWGAERAEKLASEEDLERQAAAVVDEALIRSAQELADEHDLASLIHYVGQVRSPQEVRDWVRARVDDPRFALTLITTNRGEIRNSAGRHLQLRWDVLTDLLGEQTLVDRVKQLPNDDAWPRPLSADETELLRQARAFAENPSDARRHMQDYHRQYGNAAASGFRSRRTASPTSTGFDELRAAVGSAARALPSDALSPSEGEFIAGQPSLVGCRAAVVIARRGGSLDEFVHCVGDRLPVNSCVDLGWRRNLSA